MGRAMSVSSDSDGDDKIKEVLVEIEKTKEIANQGIQKALQRGDELDECSEKSKMLSNQAEQFNKQSRKLKRHFCLQQWKLIACIFIIIIVLILAIWLAVGSSESSD